MKSLKKSILPYLKKSKGTSLSGSALAKSLGLTRAAIHKQILKLRSQGYGISGTNRVGYCLDHDYNVFEVDKVKNPFRGPCFHFNVIPSTQDEAKKRAMSQFPEGTLVVADSQSAGRGRLGRTWESPLGGLWFSLLLKPPILPSLLPGVVLVAALDWVRLIRKELKLPAQVKWPNDVWMGNRKCVGILTEMSSEMDKVQWAVLGIGVNVNNPPPKKTRVPAVSIAHLYGTPLSRVLLLNQWLKCFYKSYQLFKAKGFSPFRKEYEKLSLLQSKTVQYDFSQVSRKGRVIGVSSEGALRIRHPQGTLSFRGGEISLSRSKFLK